MPKKPYRPIMHESEGVGLSDGLKTFMHKNIKGESDKMDSPSELG